MYYVSGPGSIKHELKETSILLSNSSSSPLISELESVRVGGRGREGSGEVVIRCREGGVSRAHMAVLAIASPMFRWGTSQNCQDP